MKNISIHDNFVTGYTVSCEKEKISIHTEFRDQGEPFEKTEIKFSEVLAYQFTGDNLNTILFGIEEIPIEDLLKKYHSEFQNGTKYAWPGSWNESPEKCLEYLKNKNAKVWEISSSHGMGGFIVGKGIEYINNKNR